MEVTTNGADVLVAGGEGGVPYYDTPLAPGLGCMTETAYRVRCLGYAAYTSVVVRTGPGEDTFWVFSDLGAEIDAELGSGPDHLLADVNQQRVVARGGPGPDSLYGGAASDRLEGGPGSDGIDGGRGGVIGATGGATS